MTSKESSSRSRIHSMTCPACQAKGKVESSNAVVSPWVTELSESRNIETLKYLICKECGTGWFEIWYSDKVLNALYKAYRGEHYFRVRNSWEPTYSRVLNSNLNNGEEWLNGRRLQILKALHEAGVRPGEMSSVLDFGGGHGGVMPKFANRFLLEANETVIPEVGVQLVRNLEEAKSISLDLVMCCGVLEHLNDPTALVESIMELSSDIFLFEVPTGTPSIRKGLANRKNFLKLIAKKRYLWRATQRMERRAGRHWRQFFPLRCSEHLQFFSKSGLTHLLEQSGLDVLLISETLPNEFLADKQNLGFEAGLIAVCRKKISK